MKVIDIIFGLIAGRVVGFLLSDFLKTWEINIGFYYNLVLWVALPLLSLFFLWLANLIGRKLLFVFQVAKFLLVGVFATVIDLKVFEFLTWFFVSALSKIPDGFAIGAIFTSSGLLLPKSFSFIAATVLKYLGNKYWTFQKQNKEGLNKEITQFFIITLIGLMIDVISFYYFAKIMGPSFEIPSAVWIKLSVVFAAVTAALWNFLGYKFLVFKK